MWPQDVNFFDTFGPGRGYIASTVFQDRRRMFGLLNLWLDGTTNDIFLHFSIFGFNCCPCCFLQNTMNFFDGIFFRSLLEIHREILQR